MTKSNNSDITMSYNYDLKAFETLKLIDQFKLKTNELSNHIPVSDTNLQPSSTKSLFAFTILSTVFTFVYDYPCRCMDINRTFVNLIIL